MLCNVCAFGAFEPEPLEEKDGNRSRLEKSQEPVPEPVKKLAGSLALLEDTKHKEIVLLLLFFR